MTHAHATPLPVAVSRLTFPSFPLVAVAVARHANRGRVRLTSRSCFSSRGPLGFMDKARQFRARKQVGKSNVKARAPRARAPRAHRAGASAVSALSALPALRRGGAGGTRRRRMIYQSAIAGNSFKRRQRVPTDPKGVAHAASESIREQLLRGSNSRPPARLLSGRFAK